VGAVPVKDKKKGWWGKKWYKNNQWNIVIEGWKL
jgi:hypothetical protein